MAGQQADDMVDTLLRATNAHDLDALVACFAADYENQAPAHPSRGFRGQEQVRRNWQQIFGFVPDLRAEVTRRASAGETVWTEWTMSGTRRDGSAHEMRGVIIFGIRDGLARWARFYLEPLDDAATSIDAAVHAQVARE